MASTHRGRFASFFKNAIWYLKTVFHPTCDTYSPQQSHGALTAGKLHSKMLQIFGSIYSVIFDRNLNMDIFIYSRPSYWHYSYRRRRASIDGKSQHIQSCFVCHDEDPLCAQRESQLETIMLLTVNSYINPPAYFLQLPGMLFETYVPDRWVPAWLIRDDGQTNVFCCYPWFVGSIRSSC